MAKLDSKQRAEVCRRYLAGEKGREIAGGLGVGIGSVYTALKREGVQLRGRNDYAGGVSEKQRLEICRRYLAGETTCRLGPAFGVSGEAIRLTLIAKGVQLRNTRQIGWQIPEGQHPEICRRYLAGETTIQLGKAFGVSGNTIGRILKAKGLQIRQRGLSEEQHFEICRRYLAGENAKQLCKVFKTCRKTICKILESNEVQARTRSEARSGISSTQHAEICRRYLAGESTIQLGKAFGVSNSFIGKVLKAGGVRTRSRGETLQLNAGI